MSERAVKHVVGDSIVIRDGGRFFVNGEDVPEQTAVDIFGAEIVRHMKVNTSPSVCGGKHGAYKVTAINERDGVITLVGDWTT